MNYIAFFDTDCITCNKFINFILKIDKKKIVKFSSINSDLYKNKIDHEKKDTIVYLKNNRIYYYTDAITELLKDTHSLFKVLSLQYVLPKFLREFIYKSVTRNRKMSRSCFIIANHPHKDRFV